MKRIKRITIFCMTLLILFAAVPSRVWAIDKSVETSYTFDETHGGRKKVPLPRTYEYAGIISGSIGEIPFSAPQDLFIAPDGYIYVADTGNNRVVKLAKDGRLMAEFKNESGGGLNVPKGVFVDKEGFVFIADSQNSRVVKLGADGIQVAEYTLPESDLLRSVSFYEPTKIAVSDTGFLYIVMGKDFMTVSGENEFAGFVGAEEVGFSFVNMLVRMFASAEQKKKLDKVQPPKYNNFTIGPDGLVYAVTYGLTNQVRKITSVGKNIYPNKLYGEYTANIQGTVVAPNLTDITVSKDGILFVSELNSGRIYQYDQRGNLLSVFGGGGDSEGHFLTPVALDMDDSGNLYVLDAGRGTIQCLRPTPFMEQVLNATGLMELGEYDEAYQVWEQVASVHESYPLARNGMAQILYKNKDYKAAMEQYRMADNTKGYGEACAKYRHEWMMKNFIVVCLLVIAGIALAVFGLFGFKNLADKWNKKLFRL